MPRNPFACSKLPCSWQYEQHDKYSMINRKSFLNIRNSPFDPRLRRISPYVILHRNRIYHFQKFISNQPSSRSVSRFTALTTVPVKFRYYEARLFLRGRVRWRLKLVALLCRNVIQIGNFANLLEKLAQIYAAWQDRIADKLSRNCLQATAIRAL